jgi:hypothetical protein
MTSVCTDFKEIVDAMREDNEALRDIIAEQDAKLERAMFAIYQLHGGLFNQTTQAHMINENNAILFCKEKPIHPVDPVNIWPTTRQGDEHEERISKLEKTIDLLQKKIQRMEDKNKIN